MSDIKEEHIFKMMPFCINNDRHSLLVANEANRDFSEWSKLTGWVNPSHRKKDGNKVT